MKPSDETQLTRIKSLPAPACQDTVQALLDVLNQQNGSAELALASLAAAMSQLMSSSSCHQFVLSNPLSHLIVLLQTGAPEHNRMVH